MPHLPAHIREVCRWSADGEIEVSEIAAAALGMGVPVLLAATSGDLAPGLAAAMGSLAVGRVEIVAGLRPHLRREVEALAPAILAALLAVLCAGHGWMTSLAQILLVGIAAAVSGFSRSVAIAVTRFILFLMIVSAVATPTEALGAKQAAGFLALVATGALWTSTLSLALGVLVRRRRRADVGAPMVQPTLTLRLKFAWWRRSLARFAGWSYPVRLVSCIAIAAAIEFGRPGHHLHWIGLTVAILTLRQVEPVPVRTTQRVIGTAFGVAVAEITLRSGLPPWGLVAAVGFLAGLRPLLRIRSYLAYSGVMTPLIILIIDAGRAPDAGLLFDRLSATLIGAALVVAINLISARFIDPVQPITEHPDGRQ